MHSSCHIISPYGMRLVYSNRRNGIACGVLMLDMETFITHFLRFDNYSTCHCQEGLYLTTILRGIGITSKQLTVCACVHARGCVYVCPRLFLNIDER